MQEAKFLYVIVGVLFALTGAYTWYLGDHTQALIWIGISVVFFSLSA